MAGVYFCFLVSIAAKCFTTFYSLFQISSFFVCGCPSQQYSFITPRNLIHFLGLATITLYHSLVASFQDSVLIRR
jgi:hypothetical protein